MKKMLQKIRILLWFTFIVFLTNPSMAESLAVGDFSAYSLEGWQEKEFKGFTNYQLYLLGEKMILEARSDNSASALVKKIRVDLKKYPYLNWSWRIENKLNTENEKVKAGDDYAARIYVIIDGGILIWRTRAVDYVWANNASRGESWPNAFAGKNAMMMALRNREDKTSTWYYEKRNVYEDLKKLFDTDFQYIDAVALMTDTDNSHGQVTAYYGDIYFSEE